MNRKLFRAFLVLALCGNSIATSQVTRWSENAEGGLAHVRDFTSPSYSLIQSSVMSEGQNAFHLANPDFEDNWFEIDQTIAARPRTNLFFTSQLGAATPEQIARVQVSTDTGLTWPDTVFSQSGNGFPGEGSFSLNTVPLANYSGQNIRLRFLLDFDPPGSAFTQTDVNVGWLIDDIQIRAEFDKTMYSIGNPSAEETLYLELINRSRADALAEARRQGSSNNRDVRDAISFFAITSENIESQYQWAIDNGCIAQHAQPLAFNENLLRMAELHSEDQHLNNFQGHESSDNPLAPFRPGDGIGERATSVGYDQAIALSENTFNAATSVEQGHAAFEIDWGSTVSTDSPCYNAEFLGQGMQNPAGHRVSIHDAKMQEIGIGVVLKQDGGHVVTQNFGSTGESRLATGVVFEDANRNQSYDIGEGIGGVRVDSDGSAFFAITTESGAYSLPISDDGRQMITFSSERVSSHETVAVFRDFENVKIDYIVTDIQALAGDFNHDGILDVADIDALSATVRVGNNDPSFDLDDDGIVNQSDRAAWVHDLRNTYFGDSDLDGEFSSGDLVLMFQASEYEDGINGNSSWATGDFNGDAEFDSADFVFAFKDDGYESGPRPAIVPEPRFAWFVAVALSSLWAGRHRNRQITKTGN